MISGVLLLLAIPFLLPIIGLVMGARLRARMGALEETVAEQRRSLEHLETVLQNVRKELRDVKAQAPQPPPASPSAPPQAAAPEPKPAAKPTPAQTPALPPPKPAAPSPPPARPPVPPPVVSPPPSPLPPPPPPPRMRLDWEQLIGVRMFSAIAGIALVLAAVFFLRYSIDHGWLAPRVRVAIGLIVGIGLLVVCEMRAARRYPVTANALDAAGVAILFATIFSAHALWQLIPSTWAFALLAMVTAVAVLLSIRRDSLFIAVLGLLGGFATPVLLSTGENRPIPLFAYLLLLNAGLAWVAARKGWTILTVLTLVFTTLYQWSWVITFLTANQLSLAMGIFIVFALAGFATLVLSGPRVDDGGRRTIARTGLAGALMPLLFSVYLAAVPSYGREAGLLFGFLFVVSAGLLALSIARRDEWPHAIGAGGTVLAFAVWSALSLSRPAGFTAILATSAFVVLYAMAPLVARLFDRPLQGESARAIYASAVLLMTFTVVARLTPAAVGPLALFTPMFALLAIVAWRALAEPVTPLWLVALFFAAVAEGAWSTAHLDADRVRVALAVQATFAVFAVGVPIVARRAGSRLEPAWGIGAVLLGTMVVFASLNSAQRAVPTWGVATILAALIAAFFVASGAWRPPLLSIVAAALASLVVAGWWTIAATAAGVLPSLLGTIALTLAMLAGYGWLARHRAADGESTQAGWQAGTYFGLIGHLHLFFVAAMGRRVAPPWPLFGALSVTTLALTATSIATGVGQLHGGGLVASALIVLAWSQAAPSAWAITTLVAGEAVVAYAVGWLMALRGRAVASAAAIGTAVAVFISELTVAVTSPSLTSVVPVAAVHTVNVSLLLALSWIYRWRWVAVGAVVPAWIGAFAWNEALPEGVWASSMALTVVLYALFVAYPFVLGRRASESRDPYFAAVAASLFFFFAARAALAHGSLDRFAGAVPVVAGAIMALLLRQLLQVESPESRDLGRLALVAGAALGFATVAIPLQLSHQWITIGWALEGTALAWAYRRIPHRGLLYWSVALLIVVFVRLALNPAVFYYEPRGYRVFNWYLYTYLVCGAAMLAASWLFSATDDQLLVPLPSRASRIVPVGGIVVLFILLNIEIADYYAIGPEITFRFGVSLAQDLTYTLGWLTFGLALLAACIYLHSRPGRIAAVAMIAVTASKAFLYDMASLGGLYRVGSFIGLAASLSLVALALQKYVLQESHGG